MTGKISLHGFVLPVGGIKEQVVAAHRADIKRVLLPKRNRKDFEDIPDEARKRLEFAWLEWVDQAVQSALEPRHRTQSQHRAVARTMPPRDEHCRVAYSRHQGEKVPSIGSMVSQLLQRPQPLGAPTGNRSAWRQNDR